MLMLTPKMVQEQRAAYCILANLRFMSCSLFNPRPYGFWRVTRPDGVGGGAAPLRSPKLQLGSETFQRHCIGKSFLRCTRNSPIEIFFDLRRHRRVKQDQELFLKSPL